MADDKATPHSIRIERAIAAFGSMPIPPNADVGALLKVLEFYAKNENYHKNDFRDWSTEIAKDSGQKARAELAKWGR